MAASIIGNMAPKDRDVGLPDPHVWTKEVTFGRISSLLDETTTIRRGLTERIPEVQRTALNAGMVLKQLIGEN